ncbi:hypothetical protein ACFFWD_00790 [Bradyrhizobium erythrophlei]
MSVGQKQLCQALTSFDATGYFQVQAQLKSGLKGLGKGSGIVEG